MRNSARACALLLAWGLLPGCGMALFESPPGDATTTCDPRLVGSWRVDTPDDKSGDSQNQMFVVVAPGCRSYRLVGGGQENDLSGTTIAFSTVGKTSVLAVRGGPRSPASGDRSGDGDLGDRVPGNDGPGEQPPESERPSWERGGYVYFAYEQHGQTIRLHPVQDTAAARLIIDSRIPGRVNVVAGVPPEEYEPLEVYVIGSPASMAELVQRPDLFSDRYLVLAPVAPSDLPQTEPAEGGA